MARTVDAPSRATLRQALPWVGLVISLLALLPPYTRDLNTEMRVEVADHVVPGAILLAVSAAMVARSRQAGNGGETFPLVAGMVVLLAGLWMTATHIPLVNQARRGENEVSYLDAAWHTVPGVVVLVLGLVWTAAWWSLAADQDEPR